jgi:large subunit ribosomal protein L23
MNPKQERLMSVLLGPHVSEKAARIGDKHNQIVFRVRKDADKIEIRQAVEKMFEVKVADVQVVNVGGKEKRFGARIGRRGDWKKAYVRLAPGSEINLAGEQA